MTDSNASSPSSSASRTISLNEIGEKYFSAIQRLSDLTVFNWASARTVSEQGYDDTAKSISGLPATPFRLSFDTARAENERWVLKHGVNEILGLTAIFLEDIRKLCGLVTFNAAKANASGDLAALAAEINAPGPQDFAARLKHIRERYNVKSALEKEMLSIVNLGRVLFQQNGVVGNGETAALSLQAVQAPAEGSKEPRLAPYSREWKSGEQIQLSREEHAAIFTTVSLFFSSFLSGVQEYAQSSGLAPEPAAQ